MKKTKAKFHNSIKKKKCFKYFQRSTSFCKTYTTLNFMLTDLKKNKTKKQIPQFNKKKNASNISTFNVILQNVHYSSFFF